MVRSNNSKHSKVAVHGIIEIEVCKEFSVQPVLQVMLM
jgi:hypothetical protein